MNKYLFYTIFYLPLAISDATSQYSNVSAFYRLKSTIYDGYDPMIRPVKDPWTVTNVTIGFTLKQVLSFDVQIMLLYITHRFCCKKFFLLFIKLKGYFKKVMFISMGILSFQ